VSGPVQAAAVDLFGPPAQGHEPGGKRLPLPKGVHASAIYGGPADCYRYLLEWEWDARLPTLMAGMMNPSCAGHLCGDMTVGWVHRWSRRNGFGRVVVVNASAYRAANQARLAEVADPMGPDNERHVLEVGRRADLVVLGYGLPKVKAVRGHGPRMARLLAGAGIKLHAWGLTKCRAPRHPLYLPADVQARPWSLP
jgi:hypothetical protein